MKKIAFMFVAVAAIAFASCGNKTNEAEATDSTAVDTTVCDSTCDSTCTDSTADSTVADTVAAPAADSTAA